MCIRDRYTIDIHSPAFTEELVWHSNKHKLTLVIDNSSLEIFSQTKTLSVVTFIAGINRMELKKVDL